MRVALDFRMADHTGIGTYVRSLVRHLPAAAEDLELLLLVPDQVQPPDPLPKRTAVIPWPGAPSTYSLREQWNLPRLLDERQVDLLHVPHFHAPVLAGPPLVVTVHDLILLHFPEELPHLAARTYARMMFHLVCRRARRILTVSDFVARDLVATLAVGEKKIRVSPHGLPDAMHPLPSPEDVARVRARLGLEGEYVLSLGMQRPRKNLVRLVRAFAASGLAAAGTRLVLAGPPDPRGEPVAQEIQRLGLGEQVLQTGFVPAEDLPGLYAGARLFAFPSLHEGFGFPAVEAFRYGTPVAAARATALPEVCEDAACYFDPEDEEDMARVLRELHDDRARQKELSRRGLRRAAGLTWENSARETLRAYREALEG